MKFSYQFQTIKKKNMLVVIIIKMMQKQLILATIQHDFIFFIALFNCQLMGVVPGFFQSVRSYFAVTQGYVMRKLFYL